MRLAFLALTAVALAGSVVGLLGMQIHDLGPTVRAMTLLPQPWGAGASGLGQVQPVAARERSVPQPEDEVERYFAESFSEDVRRDIEAACPPPARHLVVACFASVHQMLAKRGQQEAREFRRFRWVLRTSRLVWWLAAVVALGLLLRAYDEVRRAGRRPTRSKPPPNS